MDKAKSIQEVIDMFIEANYTYITEYDKMLITNAILTGYRFAVQQSIDKEKERNNG